MKTEESLFLKILLWAYDQHDGFAEQTLLDTFEIKSGDPKYRWFLRVFKTGTNDNTPYIVHFYDKSIDGNMVGIWCLSERGMSAAIDYLELKEARQNSNRAMYIAFGSLAITSLIGLAQIFSSLFY